MSKIRPVTVKELIQLIAVQPAMREGIIKQKDADTIRVQVNSSAGWLRSVFLVGAALSEVYLGDRVQVFTLNGRVYAEPLRTVI